MDKAKIILKALVGEYPEGVEPRPGVCMICGCTEMQACEGGCYWVDCAEIICSACVQKALEAMGGAEEDR